METNIQIISTEPLQRAAGSRALSTLVTGGLSPADLALKKEEFQNLVQKVYGSNLPLSEIVDSYVVAKALLGQQFVATYKDPNFEGKDAFEVGKEGYNFTVNMVIDFCEKFVANLDPIVKNLEESGKLEIRHRPSFDIALDDLKTALLKENEASKGDRLSWAEEIMFDLLLVAECGSITGENKGTLIAETLYPYIHMVSMLKQHQNFEFGANPDIVDAENKTLVEQLPDYLNLLACTAYEKHKGQMRSAVMIGLKNGAVNVKTEGLSAEGVFDLEGPHMLQDYDISEAAIKHILTAEQLKQYNATISKKQTEQMKDTERKQLQLANQTLTSQMEKDDIKKVIDDACSNIAKGNLTIDPRSKTPFPLNQEADVSPSTVSFQSIQLYFAEKLVKYNDHDFKTNLEKAFGQLKTEFAIRMLYLAVENGQVNVTKDGSDLLRFGKVDYASDAWLEPDDDVFSSADNLTGAISTSELECCFQKSKECDRYLDKYSDYVKTNTVKILKEKQDQNSRQKRFLSSQLGKITTQFSNLQRQYRTSQLDNAKLQKQLSDISASHATLRNELTLVSYTGLEPKSEPEPEPAMQLEFGRLNSLSPSTEPNNSFDNPQDSSGSEYSSDRETLSEPSDENFGLDAQQLESFEDLVKKLDPHIWNSSFTVEGLHQALCKMKLLQNGVTKTQVHELRIEMIKDTRDIKKTREFLLQIKKIGAKTS